MWKANLYEIGLEAGSEEFVRAVPGAAWGRLDPMGGYVPPGREREIAPGPHVAMMNLRASRFAPKRNMARFYIMLQLFANRYGLLGLAPPLEPDEFVAPDAAVLDGRLRRVAPATKGKCLLEDLLHGRDGPSPGRRARLGESLDIPEDVIPKGAREDHGLVVVPDKNAERGVSVLSTQEPISAWERELRSFPVGEDLTRERGFAVGVIARRLKDVESDVILNADGRPEMVRRHDSLLTAMYEMLLRDVQAGRAFQRCRNPKCGRYYRTGTHDSRYCTETCASAATSREHRQRQGRR